ncbi:MAG: ECF RNA polymerase sigma factor SigW [Planctomycetes bacterium]|nr:ECF RNA polymerase sigma factor SigW [Planctomycetota bacterium]HRJ77130.1 sigma-70 family RNA polymerase sigma factor [Planctomycetota bacterium]
MDADLAEHLGRAREGDVQAFSYVVTAFRHTAMGWARRQTPGEHAAEDAVQDAFVVAFTHLSQLREVEAFAGWLQALVRSACLRQLRRRMPLLEDGFEPEHGEPAAEELLAAAELKQAVRSAVAEMKAGHAQVIERHYLAGQKLEDIARELGLPLGTVKRRLFEAREKLRFRLAGLAPGADDDWKG